jgi:membrane fusion protein, multidrug efflux system
MKKSIWIISLALLTACGGGGGNDKTKKLEELKKQLAELKTNEAAVQSQIDSLQMQIDKESGKKAEAYVPVEITKVVPQTFVSFVDVMGKVDADENVALSTEMMGTITKINVKPGDVVSKGQVLAETDNRALQESMADLKTNMELVNTLYEKQKSLWEQKIGTEVQWLQIKNQKESMEKKMAALEQQLNMTKIISPINGTVDAVDIKLGQAIAPGVPAIRVINLTTLKVKAEVAESYAARIKKGNDVMVYFPDVNDSLQSTVSYAARTINVLNRTFMVEVILDNNKEYHPNMFTRLRIKDYTSATPVPVVAVKLIQTENGQQFIMVNENGKSVKRAVKVGRTYNGTAEVVSGLKEGDEVITNGYFGLPAGESLKAI